MSDSPRAKKENYETGSDHRPRSLSLTAAFVRPAVLCVLASWVAQESVSPPAIAWTFVLSKTRRCRLLTLPAGP